MNLSFYIAKRYLFSKKSHNAINVISLISVCGIAIATMAMICTLSVFNGFTDIAVKSFNTIDPDLKITAKKGKTLNPDAPELQSIRQLAGVKYISETIEENALLRYEDRQSPVLIKGVSENFEQMSKIDAVILDGHFALQEGDVQYGIIGAGLAVNLGIRANFVAPIEIYAPKRNVRVNLANPTTAFAREYIYPAGVFAINQQKYDDQVLFISLDLARKLFRYETEATSLDIKLSNPEDISSIKKEIKSAIGDNYNVKDRFEQQEEAFRMVNIEKWVTFFILFFILIIAVFNIIGSLSMLILDKKEDILILRNLGADNKLILKIFTFEGWMISLSGAVTGLLIGLTLCLLQQYVGLLKLGSSPGAFIVEYYPVVTKLSDIAIVFVSVLLIGLLAVLYPVNSLRRNL
ncbi:MAG: FtsX-like permease family protein [Dysgonomonas sp.]